MDKFLEYLFLDEGWDLQHLYVGNKASMTGVELYACKGILEKELFVQIHYLHNLHDAAYLVRIWGQRPSLFLFDWMLFFSLLQGRRLGFHQDQATYS